MFARLGGAAKGRPVLATLLLVTGMFTLAVPGSTNFAGEFLILAGVFRQGWGYAVVGAVAIVLAAMYTLRVISAVLHERRGDAVEDGSPDLRFGQLVLVVPLVACLLALSVWPNAVSGPLQFAQTLGVDSCDHQRNPDHHEPEMIAASIPTPHVDWLALAPSLALLRRRASRSSAPSSSRPGSGTRSPPRDRRGFVVAGVFAAVVVHRTPHTITLISDSMTRDRWAGLAQIMIAAVGVIAVLVAWGEKRRNHVGEYYALIAAAGGGMMFFVQAGNLMTLFLGLEWFSIALYVLAAFDTNRRASLEAGLKYLIVGSFGSAILLFGSAMTYGATGQLGFVADRPDATCARPALRRRARDAAGRARVQGIGAPFHMWTPDVYEGAPTPVTAFMSAATKIAALVVMLRVLTIAFPEQQRLWTIAVAALAVTSLVVGNFAALAQKNVKRMLAYSSISQAGFMLIAIAANSALGGTSAALLPDPVLRRARSARSRSSRHGSASSPPPT